MMTMILFHVLTFPTTYIDILVVEDNDNNKHKDEVAQFAFW